MNKLALNYEFVYSPNMLLKRIMGVALIFVLFFAITATALHTHDDHHEHVDDLSVSSLELEADCSLCDQLAPSGDRLIKDVFSPLPPKVEHRTPLSSQSVERTEVRPIATLLLAPKTSPPFLFKRL